MVQQTLPCGLTGCRFPAHYRDEVQGVQYYKHGGHVSAKLPGDNYLRPVSVVLKAAAQAKPPEDDSQAGLFDAPIVRFDDSPAAHRAAQAIKPKLGKIQQEVIAAYRERGPMTFTQAERLPEFAHYGRSTVQKRVSELNGMGILERVEGADEAVYTLVEERIDNPLEPPRCPTCNRVWRGGD